MSLSTKTMGERMIESCYRDAKRAALVGRIKLMCLLVITITLVVIAVKL